MKSPPLKDAFKKVIFDPSGKRDFNSNRSFCMAPWTHTFISPQSERRICSISREQPQFTRHYTNQNPDPASNQFQPTTLEQHWNSEQMKSIRLKMLRGEEIPDCEGCNNRDIDSAPYKAWFTDHLFRDQIEQVFSETAEDGHYERMPISFDYRVRNTCNFKCRMCGSQLSSSWEQEARLKQAWNPQIDAWMEPQTTQRIQQFQTEVVEPEFEKALEQGQVEEIYWAGGEPLVWELHWRVMNNLKASGHAQKVFCRYSTNLSVIEWKGVNLFKDLLPHFKDYLVCCSLDAVGETGEWIRTGLNWHRWQKNFQHALNATSLNGESYKDRVKLDLTLTLPGLLYLDEYVDFAIQNDVEVIAKLVHGFASHKLLSPLALPKEILHPLIDDRIKKLLTRVQPKQNSILTLLKELKDMPTYEERFPEHFRDGFKKGKSQMQRLAQWRFDGEVRHAKTIEQIFSPFPDVTNWWNQL